jgi:hypothetical protein
MKAVLIISTALAASTAGTLRTQPGPLTSRFPQTSLIAQAARQTRPAPPAKGHVVRTSTASESRASGATGTGKSATSTTGRTNQGNQAASGSGEQATASPASDAAPADLRATPAVLAPAALPANPQLVTRLQALLPAGMAADQAAFGFRTQMQFVAAVYVSSSLGIPFGELKAKLLTQGMSLDDSIRALRPKADATAEADRALRLANSELSAPY